MRNTRVYEKLTRLFEANASPLTVPQIILLLKKTKLNPNKTTIYRQLEKMVDAGIIRHVHLESRGLAYEISGAHHHHLICRSCDRIEDLVIKDEDSVMKKIMQNKKFKVQDHHLEMIGICSNCNG